MPNLQQLKLAPQHDVLTLSDAKKRVANFQQLMSAFYKQGAGTIPRGTYIPFEDLEEIVKLKDSITSITDADTGVTTKIQLTGVRAYFTFPLAELIPANMTAQDYPVDLILVPVYIKVGAISTDTYDLIAPVPFAKSNDEETADPHVSVYDITQPCPKLCDAEKQLYS